MDKRDSKTTPIRVMSPQEIAIMTAGDRRAAAMRTIQLLRPRKVIVAEKDGRTAIFVEQ